MTERIITSQHLNAFREYLFCEEKSEATIEKYLRDVRSFFFYSKESNITKEHIVAYKKSLQDTGYAIRSINSMLASINSFLLFIGWSDCKVKNLRYQKQTYFAAEKELTKAEYFRLLEASKEKNSLIL